jgi:hypothetical protein
MARNSLTYIPGFFVKFFFQPIYTDYKAHHYAYTVQIWAHSGLKQSNFGHLKKFLFLVTVAILNGGQGCRTQF